MRSGETGLVLLLCLLLAACGGSNAAPETNALAATGNAANGSGDDGGATVGPESPVQDVDLTTTDGVSLKGTVYRPEGPVRGGVLCLHMYMRDRTTFNALAPSLVERGFVVLAIDMRGHGQSGTREHMVQVEDRDPAVFHAMPADVEAGVKWLRKSGGVGPGPLGIVGASVGCSVALHYAATRGNVRALVLLSPGEAYLGMDAVAPARRIKGTPVLMTTEDETQSKPVYEALRTADKDVEVRHATQGFAEDHAVFEHHGTEQFGQGYGVEEEIVRHFDRYLR